MIPINYFVTLYCVLYLISPFINIIINSINKKQYHLLLTILIGLFIICPTLTDLFGNITNLNGLSTISMYGNNAGYTIVNFTVMYFIGAYFKKWYKTINHKKYWYACYILSSVFIVAGSIIADSATNYCNIFVVLNAVSLFAIFNSFKQMYHPVINTIAKSTFGIFILHMNSLMYKSFWSIFNIHKYVKDDLLYCILNLVVSVAAMYFVCLVIDMFISILFKPFFNLLKKIRIFNLSCEIPNITQ
jgi:hypothetical protein